MSYTARDFTSLLGMPGFSEQLLTNHFTLYQGYVANTVKLLDTLRGLVSDGASAGPAYAELKRRLGWEFNGMRLHELYFGNLGESHPLEESSILAEMFRESFESFAAWKSDFMATGAMRGIGWVGLYQDPACGRLLNFWINEHDAGHPAGCIPLLIMDVFEHAYLTDYGLKRAEYIEAFFRNINWRVVAARAA